MRTIRGIVYGTFIVSLAGLIVPQSEIASIIWLLGFGGLCGAIAVWIYRSIRSPQLIPKHGGSLPMDCKVPWSELTRKIGALRLHYLFFVNVTACSFALSRGQHVWVILIALPLSAGLLFLIGQAVVLQKSFTNLGTVDRRTSPHRFWTNLTILFVLYIVTSILPFFQKAFPAN